MKASSEQAPNFVEAAKESDLDQANFSRSNNQRTKMTPKTRDIMEAVADIAQLAGSMDYYTGDSRKDISDFIQWAIEFEAKRVENADGSVTYDGEEYMEAIDRFAVDKMRANEGPDTPDPEGMNDQRATWASSALDRFQYITRTDDEDAVADLLSDLMHFCVRSHQSFQHQLRRARAMYKNEVARQPEDLVHSATPEPATPENDVPF